MMIFRRAEAQDLDGILALAEEAGIGMTSLPRDRDILQKRIARSCTSFRRPVRQPGDEMYLFVLEDMATRAIAGTSAIEATIGSELPFYSYRVLHHTRMCHTPPIRSEYDVLHLVNDFQDASELCTLYLAPAYRRGGNGLLLSRARFLYMAHFPQRFANTVIAEMRGVSDETGRSPFWDALGQHFFNISFAEADKMTLTTNKQFIADLMPGSPIYINLLPPEARAVIGKPHPATRPAMNLLLQEGFHESGCVDIFDAGPTIEASTPQIRTIRKSRLFRVQHLIDEVEGNRYLIANTKPAFRATIGNVMLQPERDACIVDKTTARLLRVRQGDCLRIAPVQTQAMEPA